MTSSFSGDRYLIRVMSNSSCFLCSYSVRIEPGYRGKSNTFLPGTSFDGKDVAGFALGGAVRSDSAALSSGCVEVALSDCWRVNTQLTHTKTTISVRANAPPLIRPALNFCSWCDAQRAPPSGSSFTNHYRRVSRRLNGWKIRMFSSSCGWG